MAATLAAARERGEAGMELGKTGMELGSGSEAGMELGETGIELGSGSEAGMEPGKTGMELGSGNEVGIELSVVGLWCEVQGVLWEVVRAVLCEHPELDWLQLTASALGGGQRDHPAEREEAKEEGEDEERERKVIILRMMVKKILAVMLCILRVASCQDVAGIVEGLDEKVSLFVTSSYRNSFRFVGWSQFCWQLQNKLADSTIEVSNL